MERPTLAHSHCPAVVVEIPSDLTGHRQLPTPLCHQLTCHLLRHPQKPHRQLPTPLCHQLTYCHLHCSRLLFIRLQPRGRRAAIERLGSFISQQSALATVRHSGDRFPSARFIGRVYMLVGSAIAVNIMTVQTHQVTVVKYQLLSAPGTLRRVRSASRK